MPEPIIIEQRRTLANGQTVTYRIWRASWTDQNQVRKTVSLGNADIVSKADARRAMVAKMQQNQRPSAAALTVAAWTREYIDHLDRDEATVMQYETARRNAVECWGTTATLRSIKKDQVEALIRHIRGTGVGDYTVRNRCRSLSAMFKHATTSPSRERPFIPYNPFEDVKIPNPKGASPFVYVTAQQTAKLIDAAPDANWRALIALTRLCALRLEEALNVQVEHINWQEHYITVALRENREGKGASTKQHARNVPMSAAAYRMVLARFEQLDAGESHLIDRVPLNRGTGMNPQDHMRALLEQAGILNVVKPFHDLRKSQAHDWSILHGCEHSAKWCGHSVAVALRHYRDHGTAILGLVTGKGDPKVELEAAYRSLDSATGAKP